MRTPPSSKSAREGFAGYWVSDQPAERRHLARAAHIPVMSENISPSAASRRESARTTGGRFGTQPAAEAGIDLTSAPESYVQLVTHHADMEAAAAAVTRRGWTVGEVTWPRASGEENKRTDYTPTDADAAAIRSILEADNDAPVVVYWAESEWTEDGDDRLTTDVCLVVEAGDKNRLSDTIYEVETGEPAEALSALFSDLDAEADTDHPAP